MISHRAKIRRLRKVLTTDWKASPQAQHLINELSERLTTTDDSKGIQTQFYYFDNAGYINMTKNTLKARERKAQWTKFIVLVINMDSRCVFYAAAEGGPSDDKQMIKDIAIERLRRHPMTKVFTVEEPPQLKQVFADCFRFIQEHQMYCWRNGLPPFLNTEIKGDVVISTLKQTSKVKFSNRQLSLLKNATLCFNHGGPEDEMSTYALMGGIVLEYLQVPSAFPGLQIVRKDQVPPLSNAH